MQDKMIKSYETTLEESVDTNYRLMQISGVLSRDKWIGAIILPILLILMVLPLELASGDFRPRMLAPYAGFTLLSIPLFLLLYPRVTRKRLRKLLVKLHGTAQPVPCEFEMDGEGLSFTKMGQEVRLSWKGARKLFVTADSIEINFEPAAISVIPKRIFIDSSELEEWLSFIEEHTGIKREMRRGAQ